MRRGRSHSTLTLRRSQSSRRSRSHRQRPSRSPSRESAARSDGAADPEPPIDNGDVIAPIPGVRGAQAYMYRSDEGLAIIDPGYTGSVRAVLRFVNEHVRGRLDWVILTHHHIDHAGAAFALCQSTGARLAV